MVRLHPMSCLCVWMRFHADLKCAFSEPQYKASKQASKHTKRERKEEQQQQYESESKQWLRSNRIRCKNERKSNVTEKSRNQNNTTTQETHMRERGQEGNESWSYQSTTCAQSITSTTNSGGVLLLRSDWRGTETPH